MKVILVEDDPDLRRCFAEMMSGISGHQLVGSHPSAEAAMARVSCGTADLLVVDLELPGASGIEFIRWVREASIEIPTVVWTVHEGRDVVYAALKAGAVGYLLKSTPIGDMEDSLNEIAAGGAPMSPRIARRLLHDLVDTQPTPAPGEALSVRERDVLRAVARGLTHKEIADQLGMSVNTVHSHLKHIYRKLHAVGRAEALHRAQQLGLIVR